MILMSLHDLIIKFFSGNYPIHEIIFIRSIVAILLAVLFARIEGGFRLLLTKRIWLHLTRGFLLVIAISNGVMTPADLYGEMSEIVAGKKLGRESAEEITLFKTNGIAVEDLACAFTVYQRARKQGIGQEFNDI